MGDKKYDRILIGGGPGLSWGWVPSKAIIATSHTFEKVRNGAAFGLITDNPRIDSDKLQDWKDGIVKKLTTGVRGLFKGNGVELLYGEARVAGPRTVTVRTREGATETITATKAIVVATG